MSNWVKTVLLLGALSGLLLVIGDLVAGPNGLMFGLLAAAVMNLVSVLVLRQDRSAHVPRGAGRP